MIRDRSELEVDSDLPDEVVAAIASTTTRSSGRTATVVLAILGEYGETTLAELIAGFYRREQQLITSKKLSQTLYSLKKRGLAKRVLQGVWTLTDEGFELHERNIGERE